MEFKLKEEEQYLLIELSGDIIASYQSTELFDQINQVLEKNKPYFIIDLEKLEYINSTGLSALLHVLNLSRKAGGETVLLHIPEHLMKLLVITKLHSIFTVATNIEEAIVHFKKPADTEIS